MKMLQKICQECRTNYAKMHVAMVGIAQSTGTLIIFCELLRSSKAGVMVRQHLGFDNFDVWKPALICQTQRLTKPRGQEDESQSVVS